MHSRQQGLASSSQRRLWYIEGQLSWLFQVRLISLQLQHNRATYTYKPCCPHAMAAACSSGSPALAFMQRFKQGCQECGACIGLLSRQPFPASPANSCAWQPQQHSTRACCHQLFDSCSAVAAVAITCNQAVVITRIWTLNCGNTDAGRQAIVVWGHIMMYSYMPVHAWCLHNT